MLSSDYHQMSRGISQGNQAIRKPHLIDSGKECVHTPYLRLYRRQRSSRLLSVFPFPTSRPFVCVMHMPRPTSGVSHARGVWGGACVCDTHGFAGRGHTSIEISVLPLRPASRDCHEICIHPLYTYRVSEYENGTPFLTPTYLLL